MVYILDDTIVAPATAAVESALAVIRISGPASHHIAREHLVSSPVKFAAQGTASCPLKLVPLRVRHGYFVNPRSSILIDEVLAVSFEKPHSYTGEHLVEISCHGGPVVIREILDCLIESGARIAQPGEFTFRALVNGRIDLPQAEAVNDIINAKSRHELTMSAKQLVGSLSQEISDIHLMLRCLYTQFVMSLDFAEEDVPHFDGPASVALLNIIVIRLDQLLVSSKTALTVKNGLAVPIVGIPNIGKSSLMNRLLGTERSIVTPHPGTTRDFIDAHFLSGGVLFKLIDTAGLRHSSDEIEQEGVKRTRQLIDNSDLLIVLLGPRNVPDEMDRLVLEETHGKPRILAVNKIDTVRGEQIHDHWENEKVHHLSVQTGQGVQSLIDDITDRGKKINLAFEDELARQDSWLVNKRQIDACRRALEAVTRAHQALLGKKNLDMVAFDIETAMHEFDCLLGKTSTDDILGEIFAHFCIGK